MDMKRILQAMDGVATKPVVGVDSMARFLRIVNETDLNQMPDPGQDTQADGTPTYTADELADIQDPNAQEWVAVRNQIQDAKAKGIDPTEIAKLQAHYDQLAGGNAERWERTYAKNQAVKAADQAAGYNNNVQYVNPTEEDVSFNGATQHDNGDISYQQGPLNMRQNKDGSSDTTATIGDTTARVQQNPIGVKTITAQGPAADAVNSADASAERKGVNPAKFAAFQKQLSANESIDKFLSIVKKNDVSILNEGSPHKVSLPVQMAMQHYQKEDECQQEPQVAPVGRESIVRKYFDEAEQAVQAEQHKKKQFYKQYGQQIAERVLMKEGATEFRVPPPPDITTVPEKSIGLDTVIIGNPMDPNGEPIYDVQDLVVDLGLSAIFAVGGALLTPATAGGSAAAAVTIAAPRIIRIAKALSKLSQSAKFNTLSADGRRQLLSNTAKDYAPQLKTAIKWNLGINTAVRADQATGSNVSNTAGAAYDKTKDAVKTVYDVLGNVTNERHMGFKPQGPGLQSNAPDGGHLGLSELSTDTLGKYKKAAYADAKKADAEGDYARGDKRFKGINKATSKQFDNDLKKHNQSPIKEANAKKRSLKNSNPCWDNYKPVGTKKKGGRTVPNCVPKE